MPCVLCLANRYVKSIVSKTMALNTKTFADYVDLIKRRKYYILLTWLLVSLVSVIVAYNLPKTYKSTATMLIEAAIPTNLESAASQYSADQLLQSIYQRVMTTDNVLSIIESVSLYEDIKDAYPKYQLADLFKGSTEVKLVTSTLTPKASSGVAEIAFDISFSHSEAITSKEVASKLATLFIEQNDKARTQRAIKATDFLMDESDKLDRELKEIDGKIARYKEQYNFILPEQVEGNLAAIDRMESELKDTDGQIRITKERIVFLAAELARSQQQLPVQIDGKASQSGPDSLSVLRAKYLQYSSIYSPTHPSVVRLKREIKALDPSFEGQLVEEDVIRQLAEAKRELELLEETYAEDHPEVIKRRKQIDRLEQHLKNRPARSQQESDAVAVTHTINPAYLSVETQYKSSQSELQALMQKQDYLKEKIEKMHAAILQAPQVEMAYTDLIRERDNIIKKYTQLKDKWLDAKLVQTLEEQQQGQIFTVIEQPVVPLNPEKAIRRKVAIGGFLGGIVLGLGVALLMEFLDSGIRGYRAVRAFTGLTPLVVIPYIESLSESEERLAQKMRQKKMMMWSGAALVLLAVVFIFLPFSVFPGEN
jgi:succinoglycan biosynthesis transport protein ExoP